MGLRSCAAQGPSRQSRSLCSTISSGAEQADLILLTAVTDPDASVYQGMSMFIVPTNTPGVRIFGDVGGFGDDEGGVGFGHHPYIRYQDVRVPADHLIGQPGIAFEMAQRRLSAGRMHHAMRAVTLAEREFGTICGGRCPATRRADSWPRSRWCRMMRDYRPSNDLWPTRFRPRTLLQARERLDEIIAARLPDTAGFELHELLQQSSNGNDEAIARMAEFMHMTTEEGQYAPFDPAARLFPVPRHGGRLEPSAPTKLRPPGGL